MARRPNSRNNRKGAIIVLSAFMMVIMVILLAFAIDVGYIANVRTEAQRCADAAALAAAWDMIGDDRLSGDYTVVYTRARQKAVDFASRNKVGTTKNPTLKHNLFNGDSNGDILLGRLDNSAQGNLSLVDPTEYNAVQVRVRCTADRNQQSPLFFGQIVGRKFFNMEATATAVFTDSIRGFRASENGPESSLLPFALKREDWVSQVLDGAGSDNWSCKDGSVTAEYDGIPELRLYPMKKKDEIDDGNTGAGNWGTIDIGGGDNSTADLVRQIERGPNADDLEHYDGKFILDDITGTLDVSGDTGISAGVAAAIAKIVGKPRTIPLYTELEGTGNNAMYTLVGFAGIRIVDYKLTGNDKYVLIQPAYVFDPTAIAGTGPGVSYFVGHPVHLAR